MDDSGWLDDVWAEGGAVLDLDCKCLLLYGGEDVLYDVPLRRTYLALLVRAWTGWAIRWAHEGIAHLADYVGYPRDRVLSKNTHDSDDVTLRPPERCDWTPAVASVRFGDGSVRFYGLGGDVPLYLRHGSKLIQGIRKEDGLPRLFLDEWTTEFPKGRFHLDLLARRLDF